MVGADAVENGDELRILLAVNLGELDAYELHLAEDMSREEIRRGIEAGEDVAFVGFHNRLQLIDVTDEQQLFAAEGLTEIVGVSAKDAVDEVDNVGTYH